MDGKDLSFLGELAGQEPGKIAMGILLKISQALFPENKLPPPRLGCVVCGSEDANWFGTRLVEVNGVLGGYLTFCHCNEHGQEALVKAFPGAEGSRCELKMIDGLPHSASAQWKIVHGDLDPELFNDSQD